MSRTESGRRCSARPERLTGRRRARERARRSAEQALRFRSPGRRLTRGASPALAPHHGFPWEGSDWDLRGCHVLPAEEVLGPGEARETVVVERKDPGFELDLMTDDAAKFFRMLLKKNGYGDPGASPSTTSASTTCWRAWSEPARTPTSPNFPPHAIRYRTCWSG